MNQFKNVIFEISPTEEVGDFEVKAKFMGVQMETFMLHYQDLLQLQYEGVAVMKLFDRAKVNVNLLIFLLNKKVLREVIDHLLPAQKDKGKKHLTAPF